MERKIMTINEHGTICVPEGGVAMAGFEIAQLLGSYSAVVQKQIRNLLRKGIVSGAPGCGVEVTRSGEFVPHMFGLDMVVALAYFLDTPQAWLVRKWVQGRLEGRS